MMIEGRVIGSMIFFEFMAMLAEGLVLKRIKSCTATGMWVLAGELDDGELLLLAKVQLVKQFVV